MARFAPAVTGIAFPENTLPANRPTVLIVEDDAATRRFLSDALRLGGFDVETAADGLAALRRIEEHPPDALLLDLDLPLMNGFAVHTALQLDELTKTLPIVTLTGTPWSGPTPVAAAVTKPIAPEELVKVMFDALARRGRNSDDALRTVLWLCPHCKSVVRESREPGHPLGSEMREDVVPCAQCARPSA